MDWLYLIYLSSTKTLHRIFPNGTKYWDNFLQSFGDVCELGGLTVTGVKVVLSPGPLPQQVGSQLGLARGQHWGQLQQVVAVQDFPFWPNLSNAGKSKYKSETEKKMMESKLFDLIWIFFTSTIPTKIFSV